MLFVFYIQYDSHMLKARRNSNRCSEAERLSVVSDVKAYDQHSSHLALQVWLVNYTLRKNQRMWEFERTALCILIKTLLRSPSNHSNCTHCAHPPNAAHEILTVHEQNEWAIHSQWLTEPSWANARLICRVHTELKDCLSQQRTNMK